MSASALGRGLVVWVLGWQCCLWSCSRTKVIEAFPESYVGIGVELSIGSDEIPYVVRTMKGGSARQAGMEPGDKIISIDGEATRGRGLASVVAAIRGEVGTQLAVELRKPGEESSLHLLILRRPVEQSRSDGRVPAKSPEPVLSDER